MRPTTSSLPPGTHARTMKTPTYRRSSRRVQHPAQASVGMRTRPSDMCVSHVVSPNTVVRGLPMADKLHACTHPVGTRPWPFRRRKPPLNSTVDTHACQQCSPLRLR
mgnify:CR=1 FL=1